MLAQRNRAQLAIDRLAPTVKWNTNPPTIDWREYDSVVSPWLRGDVFADKTPFGYWPLPEAENLSRFDRDSQRQYWSQAAAHFDQLDWLTRSSVVIRPASQGRVSGFEAIEVSREASAILSLNPRLRVEVPLEDDQVQFANAGNDNLVRAEQSGRLITANPGLVFSSPSRSWPDGAPRPARWLRTDLTGIIPYVGAGGDERDVRVWAWFASVPIPPPALGVEYGAVQFVRWPSALPGASSASEPADPSELVWFYPGSWFGIDEPVPTIQLKWLRRAQQDYEYLYLARQRKEHLNAVLMARAMSKPVEIQPGQSPDPTFGLMSGTADPRAWDEALRLIAQRILVREPGQPLDESRDRALNIEMLRWLEPQERPVVLGRSVQWYLDAPQAGQSSVIARLGIDIYNAADRTPDRNSLEFASVPNGWQHRPRPITVDQLATYNVLRADLGATIEPTRIRNNERQPVEVIFTDGFTRKQSRIALMLPIANTDRREGGNLTIDGSLADWMSDDLIQDGPLVRMFNRPALQRQELQLSATPSSMYTGWSEEDLYLAFKVTGLSGADTRSARNFATYQFNGRAWGEDLCELLVQAVYADNTVGPVLQAVVKPNGSQWIQRKMDPRQFADPWQAVEGAGVRYAASVDGPDWRGEVAIPWKIVAPDAQRGRPVMLRFNFTQHKTLTGESASWAGPVDYGRDENFMGALIIRELGRPGMAGQ